MLRLINKKKLFCTLCGKELKFKYKADKTWNISGYVCNECHIEKTKEFIIKKQEDEEREKRKQKFCFICKKHLDEKKKPRWQWNMDLDAFLCIDCFDSKESEYETRINFCIKCNKKMGFIRYNPKPKWNVGGQLCRLCWDDLNSRFT